MKALFQYADLMVQTTRENIWILLICAYVTYKIITVLISYDHAESTAKAPERVESGDGTRFGHRFFSQRWSFFQWALERSATSNFSFQFGKTLVIGIGQSADYRTFFESEQLGFIEGYSAMLGLGPSIPYSPSFQQYFKQSLVTLLKQDRLRSVLPKLLADTQQALRSETSDAKNIDAFDVIPLLIFRLTLRIVFADKVADDMELVRKIQTLYHGLHPETTAKQRWLPWTLDRYSPSRLYTGLKLWYTIYDVVRQARNDKSESGDAVHILLRQGGTDWEIVNFILIAISAAQVNTAMMASWVTIYLGTNNEWQSKVSEEIHRVASRYSKPGVPALEQLSNIPVQAWQSEFVLLNACLRETIRMQLCGCLFRKSTATKAISLRSGEVIPGGSVVAFAPRAAHYNAEVFPEPHIWDPSRHLNNSLNAGFVGWGLGRHPCIGIKTAQMEISIIVAHIFLDGQISLVTQTGDAVESLPVSDVDSLTPSPPPESVYIKNSFS